MTHFWFDGNSHDQGGVAHYSLGAERVSIKVEDFKTAHRLSQLMESIYNHGKRDELISTVKSILEPK